MNGKEEWKLNYIEELNIRIELNMKITIKIYINYRTI